MQKRFCQNVKKDMRKDLKFKDFQFFDTPRYVAVSRTFVRFLICNNRQKRFNPIPKRNEQMFGFRFHTKKI